MSSLRAKSKKIQDFMVALVTCKNEEDPIKNEGARVATRLYVDFFRRSRADNSIVNGGIWPKLESYTRIYACPQYLQE